MPKLTVHVLLSVDPQLFILASGELASRNIDSVSPQELSLILAPKAEELVPSTLRAEIQEEIRRFLEEHVHIA